ncbi:3-methyl-2-oxobutanoate hydroxymethyltransferase [Candidatus Phycosocius spiralis]|uniref:3-methyl-2-oxobutanoate hydroxymethyltransferase n=1 Tax=Candidatus Phycosocius spiralis TaxID=2815099 RepID=A0ABQ4PYG7_9PROT|nr:3-methyl-2-oxobutanoate hydroxymethyltransferase [Candidatus Phycosocius spiralis]GIU68114.1 3-methyl-2-oxobutanoate hydroxymethyltransferase [Candidatus Phycosocius spiralis]
MSAQIQTRKRKTVCDIVAHKGGEPVVCLTAYTAPIARLLDPHADILLVGDSLGMVVHGLSSTVGVTIDMMILHGRAVMRGAQQALVVVDLPFGSYEESHEVAWRSASRVMMETGCQAVKVESGEGIADTIAFLVARGIPVMGHVGLRPQAINVDGSFRAKGRTKAERDRVLREALAADRAGAFAIVVEGVDEEIAAEVSSLVRAPTIGIGASARCDGQILVTDDMLGLFDWTPKFVRRYADLGAVIDKAVADYAADVRARSFPAQAETYVLKPS